MLECLVINNCNDIEFVSSLVDDIFHDPNYDMNITYYKPDKHYDIYDILLYFPKYEEISKNVDMDSSNRHHDMHEFIKMDILGKSEYIKFDCYSCITHTIDVTDKGMRLEDGLICTSHYNLHDYESFMSGASIEEGRLYSKHFERSAKYCVTRVLNGILANKYLESARDKQNTIRSSIEFPPEYHQTGLGILNYFGTVIRHRYPDIPVMVRIEQEGLIVRMIIQTSEGHRETVEHTLQAYGLVIAGKMLPEELLSDPYHVLELKHKLELAQTELRLTHNLLQIAERQNQDQQHRLLSVETEMANLQQLMGDFLQVTRGTQQHAQELTSLLQPLLTNLTTQHDTAFQQAVVTLKGVIDRGMTTQDEQTVKEALATLQQKEPGVLQQMVDLIGKNAITGSAGRLLYDWLMHLNVIFR